MPNVEVRFTIIGAGSESKTFSGNDAIDQATEYADNNLHSPNVEIKYDTWFANGRLLGSVEFVFFNVENHTYYPGYCTITQHT